MAMLAVIPVAESYWVARERRAVWLGAGAAVISVLAAHLATSTGVLSVSTLPIAAHWLVPVAYCVTLAVRLAATDARTVAETEAVSEASDIESRMNALIMRLNRTGDVQTASHQAETILKLRPDILLGNGFFERIHVGDRVGYLCAVSDTYEDGMGREVSVRLRMPAQNGGAQAPGYRRFGIELLRREEAGEVVAILRDEADRAEIEHALAEAREHARQARVESKRMLATVSHELRTPLNAIIGFSDTLQTEIFGRFSNDKQREYVRLIHEAGGHLLSIVNSTLEISRLEAGTYTLHPEAFRFAEAVDASVAFAMGDASARSIEVDTEVSQDVGVIYCDRRAVQQILINLVSNAVKFSHANGKVRVAAERRGNRLDFSVSDTGVGIAADDLERIGEPFAQVRNDETRHVEGTGLGLALVKGLVSLHGGGMSIDSAPGEGTRVSVSLPVGVGAEKDMTDRNGRTVESEEWSDEEYRKTA
ncbi:PAS domain-containing sensor histidine kinase [Nitratireductor sp. GISD-1A_MAKvit]|uniref:sensor histidine kinase n=1 Tax=Nitratireductor sp. GISD-1A_MAKvit TaxID=3234198 RepID=UPI0034672AF6